MMRAIGGKNTGPELALRRKLHRLGLRYRLHDRELPGTPDLVFPRFRAVCFVHGCFWHRHPGCRHVSTPSTRQEYWLKKFEGNVARDIRARKALLDAGWRVAVVWECALRGAGADRASCEIREWLHGTDSEFQTAPDPPKHSAQGG